MSVRIITDSSCDHSFLKQQEWKIDILPMRVYFGDKEYVDGRDLSSIQFYEMLAQSAELPHTTQITPFEFEDRIRPYVEAGDEVVILPLSKDLSGTYSSAVLAKEQFPGKPIYVVDTCQVTFSLGLLVEIAVQMRDSGRNGRAIAERLEILKDKVRLYAVIGDLKYLKLGGRLSSASATIGSLLNIKPIIAIEEGKVNSIVKVRGLKAGYESVLSYSEKDGIDTRYPVYFGHSNIPEAAEELKHTATERFGLKNVRLSDIGPIVGTHAGPGATGIAFITL